MKDDIFKKMRLLLFILFASLPLAMYGQQTTVTGTVTDSTSGASLPGVNIVVDGTTIGTTTDIEGNYQISVPDQQDVLVFSFVGYQVKRVPVRGRTTIDVALESKSEELEEVVVVGYGTQEKESVVGAVSQVSGENLEDMNVGADLETSLQGQMPGLTVFTQDPTPGESNTTMQIRAATSMGNNSPLLVVDGVEQQSISDIDPIEIQSISVLKGASATAVYGVKGANGVVIVNTKRGRKGQLQLNFSSEVTMKEPTRVPEFMNAYETLKLRNEAYKNDGMWDMLISDETLEHYRSQDAPYLYPSFDWSEWLWQPAMDHKYNLNARGGNDFVQYFASISYLNEGDIMNNKRDKAFPYEMSSAYKHDRYNFRTNLDFNLSETTDLSLQLAGNVKQWDKPIDYYTQELYFEPVTSMPYYPEEAIEKYPDERNPYNQTGVRPFNNPNSGVIRLLWVGGQGVQERKANDLTSSLIFKQELDFITKGLSAQAHYSYNSNQSYGAEHWMPQFYGYHLNPQDTTWTRYTNTGDQDMNTPQPKMNIVPTKSLWDAFRSHYYKIQADYDRSFGRHNVEATGVFSRRESQGIADFPHYEENWVARATYNYNSRYFLEASVAHTGSEKFAPGLRFGTFPSFAGGWMISNEDFFRSAVPWMNHLKVKYSWGKIGSDAGIDRWLYRSSYQDIGGSVGFGYPTQSYGFIGEGNIPIPNATWETAVKQNLGIEMEFFDNLISLDIDLYKERRQDILQSRQSIPTWIGVSQDIRANVGETKAHGVEVALGFDKTFGNSLNIFADISVSAYESRVVYWDEPEAVPFHLKAEGKPVGVAQRMDWYTPGSGIQTQGYYQDFDELFIQPRPSGGQPIVGDHKYLDFNGDGAVNSNDYVVSQHPFNPTYNWNGTLGFRYKNWTGHLTFYGISSVDYPLRQGGMFFLYPFTQNKDNAMTIHSDHWTPENRDAQFPAVHYRATDQWNYRISDFSIIDGQYMRLKNVRIGYDFSGGVLDNVGVERLNLSLTGTNLYTWVPNLDFGGDPEGANWGTDFGAYPMQRRFSLKAQITF